uniref:C-terminal of Roc, COR, domain n=1 Tax=Candidatus Kentrum eta TaxID=2126337 RepID=A0A450UY65_9GAMM|nr:MAG: C-terminal of Roc, COR, domain [Candidatus Kentron sp. H]VFJ91138.1 MAG: C-terminal of Roc, COR, domain [Candidatus Kentron sp. H]VFJ97453.1 MAG: C-terminal of Roc, COR, domain [Candidatus Kentron sp. H]
MANTVYCHTHQLFFSASAVYLVVWKPREGPQADFVKEWISLIKHREPAAKILVVATHGDPQQCRADIDRQEIWDIFGTGTVIDFLRVENKPDQDGQRRGIKELKAAIARIAAKLPGVGREVPKRWQAVRAALAKTKESYLPLEKVFALCREHNMEDDEARLFVTLSHQLGHLIHYEHDPALQDTVVLKPDWLATAISFVLNDQETCHANGLVRFSRLSRLWGDLSREKEFRYPEELHPIFLRLMERFDLSYRVAGLSPQDDTDPASLVARLVPDTRPEAALAAAWPPVPAVGDGQQMQICRIVDDRGQSATAEGLFYRLIVRLHRFSLGRERFHDSVHWQRSLVLDDGYNGRALLEHIGNDVRITVRAAYPERFLTMLTEEVRYLVEKSVWKGLRCEVMVPCIAPCGEDAPGTGLFQVEKLIDSKRKRRPEYPCPVCNEWQDIDALLRNAPAVRPVATTQIGLDILLAKIADLERAQVITYARMRAGFAQLDANDRQLLSRVDDAYDGLMHALTDEAKDGPRLFSLEPVDRRRFDPRGWIKEKFRFTLWCEHSRLPLPVLYGDDTKGVCIIELERAWVRKVAPFLKVVSGTLRLALPVAALGLELTPEDGAYEAIQAQLDSSQDIMDALKDPGFDDRKVDGGLGGDAPAPERSDAAAPTLAHGAILRELHAILKKQNPGCRFGGLVRVRNKRNEFLWVHPRFQGEY